MNAIKIRDELRTGVSDDLQRRRRIIGLSVIGLVDFGMISLFQTGIIKRLPDIPLDIFDSNKVNASKEAYQFGVPDGPVSATVYGLTMTLAAAGGSVKTGRQPIFDLLLGGAIAANAAGALYYLYDMVFKQRRICLYCLSGAAVNIGSAIIAAPMVLKALEKWIPRTRTEKQ